MHFKRAQFASDQEYSSPRSLGEPKLKSGRMRGSALGIVVLSIVLGALLAALVWLGTQRLVVALAGTSVYAPEDAEWLLSESAQALVHAAYAGLDDGAVVQDYWVHALSLGQRGAGDDVNRSFVNPDLLSWQHPLQRLRAGVLLTAAGVTDIRYADSQYLARLLRLARALPGAHKLHLVAVDQRYSPDGRPQPRASAMAVDNDYVWSIAQAHPDLIEAVVSVHPYRWDAVEALAEWAQRGINAVAWMPMLQDIDPAADTVRKYYDALIAHDMTLYVRTGAPSAFAQASLKYGNPMRYRSALDVGVNIVMVHVSGKQQYPAAVGEKGRTTGTELLLHLLRNPDYDDNLHVALAGAVGANRAEGSLMQWLQHPQVTAQLLYASGYPRPAVAITVDLQELAAKGFITRKQARALSEIRRVNPLLFDFVLMRTIRLPYTDLGLPAAVFTREATAPTPD